MTSFLRFIAIFFLLLVATTVMMDVSNTEFGKVDFFDKHTVFFLLFVSFFPRLTLLFSSVPFGGFFWWLGLFFCPRILVASLATVAYFHTNPILVTISWFVALSGEAMEKWGLGKRGKFVVRTFRHDRGPHQEPHTQPHISDDGVIEAEFTKKS